MVFLRVILGVMKILVTLWTNYSLLFKKYDFIILSYYIFDFTLYSSRHLASKVEYIIRSNNNVVFFVNKNNVYASGNFICYKIYCVATPHLKIYKILICKR